MKFRMPYKLLSFDISLIFSHVQKIIISLNSIVSKSSPVNIPFDLYYGNTLSQFKYKTPLPLTMSKTSEIFILHSMCILACELSRINSANSIPCSTISLKTFPVTVPSLISAFFSLSIHSVASSTPKALTVAETNLSMTEILSGYFYIINLTLYNVL